MLLENNAKEPASQSHDNLEHRLRAAIKGEVRFDNLSRTLFATDASIYEITPVGVAFPRDVEDVVQIVAACRDAGVPLVARGAGTGLAGGAVGAGLQLDLSRLMNRIGTLDREAGTIVVEPGVVLDDLNRHLQPAGLQFAPDVATSSRATIGGMIANNSCGAHSVLYGRTVDHVAELKVVLADGEVLSLGGDDSVDASRCSDRRTAIERSLARIATDYAEEINVRFPKILRSNGGYGLDRLSAQALAENPIKILCGSEGTLGIVVGAKLKLVPLPKHRALMVLHYGTILDSLSVVPTILGHKPAAVELVDQMIIDAGRNNATIRDRCDFLKGNPAAVLIVEFFDESADLLGDRVNDLRKDATVIAPATATSIVREPDRQADVWNLRKSGLGLLMSNPGDRQPYAFVEDTAVAPDRLKEYIERFGGILDREGVSAGYYAHASVGCLHVRPVLNLKSSDDVARMRRLADAVSDLALEFGGTMTGEHGDGLLRSCWLEKMYGTKIIQAFREVKELFDPSKLLNPNKIVDPLCMTDNLRYGSSFAATKVKSYLDFQAHGGMAGLAGMCSGVGQCRQRGVETMCPSFVATGDETHTTRARANALRVALSNRGLLDGLADPQLHEVMDLCLSCKACKSECPTGVDMARLKAEFLAQRILRVGASRRDRFVAGTPRLLKLASQFPRTSNWLTRSAPARALLERYVGFDKRMQIPQLANRTFRAWFRRHKRKQRNRKTAKGDVVYFVDTWTNYLTPAVGMAAVKLLERAGYRVLCPPVQCCGRPAISKGLLGDARQLAEANIRKLAPYVHSDVPIVGTEPSCIFTLADEYPQLVGSLSARLLASRVLTIESFLRKEIEENPNMFRFQPASGSEPASGINPAGGFETGEGSLLYHAHCHQKALVGTADAVALLKYVWQGAAKELDTGCCGMAGSFGHEKEHYDVAQAIGEERLFPAVRERGSAAIAVSGFSCRQQIEHHTGVSAKHVVEHLSDALL